MTPPGAPSKKKPRLNDKLADWFRQRPNRWVSYRAIAQVAGFGGWRTRLSELRRSGMTFDKPRIVTWKRGDRQWTETFYRYLPKEQ